MVGLGDILCHQSIILPKQVQLKEKFFREISKTQITETFWMFSRPEVINFTNFFTLKLWTKWIIKRSYSQHGDLYHKIRNSQFSDVSYFRSFKVSIFHWSWFHKHSLESYSRVNLTYDFSSLEHFPCWILIFTGLSETITVDVVLSLLYSLLMYLCCLD